MKLNLPLKSHLSIIICSLNYKPLILIIVLIINLALPDQISSKMTATSNLAVWNSKQLFFSPDDIKHPTSLSQLQLEMLTCQICLMILSSPQECATC